MNSRITISLLFLAFALLPSSALAATPTIGGISVNDSSNLLVTIWGSGFAQGATVFVGGVESPSTWLGGTQFLVFEVPTGGTGTVDVKVVNADGGTATLPGGFTYGGGAVLPLIRGVAPSDTVSPLKTVWGENFETGAKVYVNGIAATSQWQVGTQFIVFQPPTSIPSGSTVTVKVVNPSGGSNSLAANLSYTTVAGGTTGTTDTGSTGGSSSPDGIKWHPGVYIAIDPEIKGDGRGTGPDTGELGTALSHIDAKCTDKNVTGFLVSVAWGALEGNTQGDYQSGFGIVDQLLSHASKCGKRLMLREQPQDFGTAYTVAPSCSTINYLWPTYLCNAGLVAINATGLRWSGSLRTAVKLWDPTAMGYIMAMSDAYAARYNTNPYFEMVEWTGETAIGGSIAGYSNSALVTQLARYVQDAVSNWTKTQIRVEANYLGNDTTMEDLMSQAVISGTAWGGPDNIPGQQTNANYVWRGCNTPSVGTACIPHSGWTNYSGTYPWVAEVQSPDYTGNNSSVKPGTAVSWATGTMHNNYMIFYEDTGWTGNTSFNYNILKLLIAAGSAAPYSTACPTGFTSGCNTN